MSDPDRENRPDIVGLESSQKPQKALSVSGVSMRIGALLVCLFVSELAVMFVLPLLPPLPSWLESLIDAGVLVLVMFPATYLLLFRPGARRSEARYRSLFENLLNGFAYCKILLDDRDRPVDFVYLEVNDAFRRLTGLRDVVGKRVSEVIPGILELSPEVLEIYGRVAATRKPERFHFDFKSQGTWLDISVYSPEKGYFIALFDDITERKRAAEAVSVSELRYRRLFEAAQDGILILDAEDGDIVDVNPFLVKLLGLSREHFLGKKIWEIGTFKDVFASKEKFAELQNVGYVRYDNLPLQTVEGRKVQVEFVSNVYMVDQRKVIQCNIRDITARKLAETQNDRITALVEASTDFIGFADSKTAQVHYINKAGRRMCGIGEDEDVRNLKIGDVHPAWVNKLMAEVILPAAVRDGVWEGEAAFLNRNGRETPVSMVLMARKSASGEADIFYTVSRDITERKKAEVELRQSQKMESVGRLAGGVAHDFNNILTAINGYAGFAMAGLAEGDQRREDLKEVLAAGERATRLTRQLLAFSRKQILNPQVLDINAVVGGIANMLKRIIGEDIKFETQLASQPCLVKVDAGQIEQVFLNLAVNARDAMPKGGTITLETKNLSPDEVFISKHPDLHRGPLVCLSVRDTGCGMTEEVQTHLFEPFFTTKGKGNGTGLGLSMVYGIVKQSGGDIEVESAPDRGTTFRIYFPQNEIMTQDEDKEEDRAKDVVPRGNETILFVEDEAIIRGLGKRALTAMGYTVLVAADGQEALEVIERHGRPVDLLITDVVMPGMSGRELAQKIAKNNMARRTLFVSGYTDDAIVQHGVLEPGLAFLYKPFTPDALLHKLREVLDGPADQAKA